MNRKVFGINPLMSTMMKNLKIFALAALLILASCSQEKTITPMEVTIYATVPDDATKIVVDDNGNFSWKSGDQIGVFVEGQDAPVALTLKSGAGTSSASFSGPVSGTLTGYAFYPYNSDTRMSGTVLNLTIAHTTSYNDGRANALLYAKGIEDGAQVSFHQLASLVKVTYKEIPSNVAMFRFVSKGEGMNLSGTASADLSEENPMISTPVSSSSEKANFTINVTEGTPKGEMHFYVPVTPGDYNFTTQLRNKSYSILSRATANKSSLDVDPKTLQILPTLTVPGVYTFEDGARPENVTDLASQSGKMLSVVDNPFSSFASASGEKVLKGDLSAGTNSTSGYFMLYLKGNGQGGSVLDKQYIPGSVRSNMKTFRLRFYHTSTTCFPRVQSNVNSGTNYLPSAINGHDFTGDNQTEENWNAWFKTDDWNILEWSCSIWGKTSFGDIITLTIRPFSLWNGSNIPAGAATEATPRIFYIEDMEFLE